MTQITIYHNPKCSKSRQTLELLKEKGIEPKVIEYLKNIPTKEELKELIKKLNITPKDLLRTNEDIYKELKKQNGEPNEMQAIEWMLENPKLIERPIVVKNDKAVLGRPPENIKNLL